VPYRYTLAGLFFFVIPAVIFYMLGGVRWAKRVLGSDAGPKGRYQMVKDLEK